MSNRQESYEKNSLEENFTLLEKVLEQLEGDDLTLEEAFGAYRKGMDILQVCNEQIDTVEKKVLKLNQAGELEEMQ